MTVFWIIVAVLIIAVIAGLLPALLRTQPRAHAITQNLMLRDIRIAELQRDVADQVIDEQVLSSAEDEIARALLEETDADASGTVRVSTTVARWLMTAIIVCGVPAIAMFTYLNLGAPHLATGVAPDDQLAESTLDQKTIDDLVARLQQRLVDDPDSAEGWMLLGRTYMALNRYDEAVPALARAHELVGDVAEVLLQYADALAMADGGRIGSDVRALVTRALEVEPENVAGLWLAGLGAAEAGERLEALDYLRQAQAVSVRNGSPTAEVEAAIRELEGIANASDQPVATTAAASVTVKINVAPALIPRITSHDVLFVFARTPNQSGPPLAVTRMPASSLPGEVVLDETMAMAPMFKLKAGETVTVTARISKSGMPTEQPGDLQATSSPFVVGEVIAVNLIIDKITE